MLSQHEHHYECVKNELQTYMLMRCYERTHTKSSESSKICKQKNQKSKNIKMRRTHTMIHFSKSKTS